jgi:hypothetical protein
MKRKQIPFILQVVLFIFVMFLPSFLFEFVGYEEAPGEIQSWLFKAVPFNLILSIGIVYFSAKVLKGVKEEEI